MKDLGTPFRSDTGTTSQPSPLSILGRLRLHYSLGRLLWTISRFGGEGRGFAGSSAGGTVVATAGGARFGSCNTRLFRQYNASSSLSATPTLSYTLRR